MFHYNPNATYSPNGGKYLQQITAKDLYEQQIVVKETVQAMHDVDDQFTAKFPNVFTNFVIPQMRVEDPIFKNWEHHPMKLWQTQLNFAVFCATSACGVSSAHLNYKRHPLVRSVYRFHAYYHIRRILKRMEVRLPHESGFNVANNPYSNEEYLKLCDEYDVPTEPLSYRFEKFFATYQTGSIYDDTINENSMFRWVIQTSQGFTHIGSVKISESIRAYVYLLLTSQVGTRSVIIGAQSSSATAQRAYLHTFEDIVNRRVDYHEDIKRYEDTLNYASSKVDYSVGEGLYMLPSNMKLSIRPGVVGYNNKIMISRGLALGTNKEINKQNEQSKFNKSSTDKGSTHHQTTKPTNNEHEIETNKFKESGGNKPTNQSASGFGSKQERIDKQSKINALKKLKEDNKKNTNHLTNKEQPTEVNPNLITPEEEKIALVIAIVCGFATWRHFSA